MNKKLGIFCCHRPFNVLVTKEIWKRNIFELIFTLQIIFQFFRTVNSPWLSIAGKNHDLRKLKFLNYNNKSLAFVGEQSLKTANCELKEKENNVLSHVLSHFFRTRSISKVNPLL